MWVKAYDWVAFSGGGCIVWAIFKIACEWFNARSLEDLILVQSEPVRHRHLHIRIERTDKLVVYERGLFRICL